MFVTLVVTALLLAACGGGSPEPPAASTGTPGATAKPETTVAPTAAALTSADVCRLLAIEEVEAILGFRPNPTPQQEPPGPGVSTGRCVWDAGSSNGELTLTVMQGQEGVQAQILDSTPIEGEALSGIGDQAGVTVQGNFSVEVMARSGRKVMTLSAMAMGVTDRKDAVIAAARSVATKL